MRVRYNNKKRYDVNLLSVFDNWGVATDCIIWKKNQSGHFGDGFIIFILVSTTFTIKIHIIILKSITFID